MKISLSGTLQRTPDRRVEEAQVRSLATRSPLFGTLRRTCDRRVKLNELQLINVISRGSPWVGALKWRTRNVHQQRSRMLPQVTGAILTQGRMLKSTLRRINALVAAAQLYPTYLFVNSEENPADLPSRFGWHMHLEKKRRLQKRSVKSDAQREDR